MHAATLLRTWALDGYRAEGHDEATIATYNPTERAIPGNYRALLEDGSVETGDLVIFTKGDLDGVSGSTNAMKILPVEKS